MYWARQCPCPKLDFWGNLKGVSLRPREQNCDQAPSLNQNKMNSVGNVGQQVRAAGSSWEEGRGQCELEGQNRLQGVRRAGAYP